LTKKIIALVVVLGAFAANVFAQFTVGGGMDMILVPLQVVMRDTVEYEKNIWFGSGAGGSGTLFGIRTRLNLSASHEEKFGFRTDIWFLYSNNGANLWTQEAGNNPNSPNSANPNAMEVRLGDYGEVWWRPAEWLRFDVGRVVNTAQSGYIGDYWLSAWSIGMFDNYNIFSYHYSGSIGFLAQYTPPQIEGLSVYVFVPQFGMPFTQTQQDYTWPSGILLANGGDRLNDPDNSEEVVNRNSNRALRVFERTWLTVGYKTSNMHARLQFIGANPGGSKNWMGDGAVAESYAYRVSVNAPRIEAAFAYLVAEKFVIDVGVKSWLPISNWVTDTYNNDIDTGGYMKLSNTGTYWGGIGFGLGMGYTNESLNNLMGGELVFYFRADGDMLRSWQGTHEGVDAAITNPLRLSFHFWPSYTFPGGNTITLHGGVNYIGRNTVDIGGADPNVDSADWENSDRLRFGGGLSFDMSLFGSSSISFGLAYSHGTGEAKGGEPRTISIPINFYFHW